MRGPVPFLKGIVLGTKRINSVFCHPAIKSAPDRNQWNHSARPVCNIQSRIKGRICRYLFAKEGDVYSCSYVSVLQGYRLSELSHKHSYSRSILFSFPNKLNAIIWWRKEIIHRYEPTFSPKKLVIKSYLYMTTISEVNIILLLKNLKPIWKFLFMIYIMKNWCLSWFFQ